MDKQYLIEDGYKYICTQKSSAIKMELWAKLDHRYDMITYLYYRPDKDIALNQTSRIISFEELDMMMQMRDKMRKLAKKNKKNRKNGKL